MANTPTPDCAPTTGWRHATCAMRLILLLFAATLLANACSKSQEAVIPPGSTVLALGDSLTEGAGVTRDEAWPHLVAGKTGWNVINAGVSGNTSADALRRLPALLEQHTPALVLVTLGGNDMLRRVPQQETVANLEQIIALVRAHGASPLLLATPNPSLMGAVFQHLSAPAFYRQIAEAQHVPLIEDAMPEVLSNPQLKVDQLHPNAAGHLQLADKIYRELGAIGYVRRK